MRMINPLLFLFLAFFALNANAVLRIEVTQGVAGTLPIAIVPFAWEGADAPPEDLAEIIASDLARSGKFSPVAREDLAARPRSGAEVTFNNWKVGGVENLVIGKLKASGADTYLAQFQLFDVYKEEQIAGYSFTVQTAGLRHLAHEISDIIFAEIIGVRGAFNTRVAYVSAVLAADGKPVYELKIADSDGYNPQTILKSERPLMSPSWSPNAEHVAYVSFENLRTSAIYVQAVSTDARREISSVEGINGAPVWSPDGSRLALTLSHKGNPDIYLLNIADGSLTQLTRNQNTDTEPSWNPSGTAIVFTSDRSGTPQLYQIPVAGGRAQRLTFEGDYNASGVVSPDGKRIAMVHGNRGRYRIAVLDRETSQLRVLTDGQQDESPSFAPNGSMIIYATAYNRRGVLGVVSTDGRMKQRFTLSEGEVREPEWSPYLTNK